LPGLDLVAAVARLADFLDLLAVLGDLGVQRVDLPAARIAGTRVGRLDFARRHCRSERGRRAGRQIRMRRHDTAGAAQALGNRLAGQR